jgi:RNA polymerase sigma-70 factor (ECF subfamily)
VAASDLADSFLASVDEDVTIDRAELEGALQRILAEAHEAWGELEVSPETFARYLAERVGRGPRPVRPEAPLDGIHATDLFLACACADGDPAAIAIFEERFLDRAEHALRRLRIPSWAIDETKQVLRCRFFLPRDSGDRSAIEDYSGHGPLRSWVSAAAVNASFRVIKTPPAEVGADSFVMKAVSAPGDLEVDYLKQRYAHEFEDALREVFASLIPRERNILRVYHLDSAGIDGVASMYRVHRVTAWRWVRRITVDLHARARERMREQAHARRDEMSSVLRLIESRIDAILRNVLTSADSANPGP